jgi:hypothetical protein
VTRRQTLTTRPWMFNIAITVSTTSTSTSNTRLVVR